MSIDRVGSFAYSQYFFSQLQRAANALETTNRQVSTGKVADTYYGYGEKTAVMEAARSAASRADANVAAAKQASDRLDLQDTLLSQLSDLADQVRQALTSLPPEVIDEVVDEAVDIFMRAYGPEPAAA